ncbi:MAG TPA: hypothetical protein VHM30_18435 [Gemmatimonadaceae bacterium]|nr:hypothetical protein [Gemmatimonadaceae bacterium]
MMYRFSFPAAALIAAVACASSPRMAQLTGERATPLRRLADSTERLVTYATLSSDSAIVVAALAATDTALDDLRARVLSARAGAEAASGRMAQAVLQGDRLRRDVVAETRGGRQAEGYTRYWLLGREKLLLARAYSDQAVLGADSVLRCPEQSCARSRTRLVHGQLTSASGAAREAESLVRVAMRYID